MTDVDGAGRLVAYVAFRVDIGSLRAPRRTADGRLRIDGWLTRSGVFEYRNPDGSTRREYRPPEEVFNADSLASAEQMPVTNNHPATGLLSTQNAREYAVGATGESVRQDGDHVAAGLVVYDAQAIKDVESGKAQLSCGYALELEMTAGVSPEGERYDAVQRNIRYNHVAIVDVGRAGTARLRLDAADSAVMSTPYSNEDQPMEELKAKLAEAITAQMKAEAERDAATARADAAEQARAKVEGERDAATARADAAEQARVDAADPAKINARVDARVALLVAAAPVLGPDVELAPMTDREIKVAVVKHVDGAEIGTDKVDAYVDARYDSVIERASKATGALAQLRSAAELGRVDGVVDPEAKARAEMIERNRKAHNPNAVTA